MCDLCRTQVFFLALQALHLLNHLPVFCILTVREGFTKLPSVGLAGDEQVISLLQNAAMTVATQCGFDLHLPSYWCY